MWDYSFQQLVLVRDRLIQYTFLHSIYYMLARIVNIYVSPTSVGDVPSHDGWGWQLVLRNHYCCLLRVVFDYNFFILFFVALNKTEFAKKRKKKQLIAQFLGFRLHVWS